MNEKETRANQGQAAEMQQNYRTTGQRRDRGMENDVCEEKEVSARAATSSKRRRDANEWAAGEREGREERKSEIKERGSNDISRRMIRNRWRAANTPRTHTHRRPRT